MPGAEARRQGLGDVSCGRFCLRSCMRRMSVRLGRFFSFGTPVVGWMQTEMEDRSVMRVTGQRTFDWKERRVMELDEAVRG